MKSLVPVFETIDRMSLAEKELIAWYASKELSKEKQDQLQADAFVEDEMKKFPAPPELLALTKRSGKPKDPNSLRGLIEFIMNEKKSATKMEIRNFVLGKRPEITEGNLTSQLFLLCRKGFFERNGWGDQTIFTIKAA